MRRSKGFKGFTLIELMIMIAIIAIIAAIAIPGLLQAQRASNERNASASLKTMATANTDFRSNDRDGNHINDFWTADVAGLYTIYPPAGNSGAAVKLIELSIAAADGTNKGDMTPDTASNQPGSKVITTYNRSAPKAGYWYYALLSDASTGTAADYKINTDGGGANHNASAFAFGAYPDSFSAGRNMFLINEGNTMFKRQVLNNVRAGTGNPPTAPGLPISTNSGFLPTSDDPSIWPSDTSLINDYSKMD